MRFTATLVALAALASITIAKDPCAGDNKCSQKGALKCTHHSAEQDAVWWCRDGCWGMKNVCPGKCDNEPEPHCRK
ncbi:hypothetical protein IQ06DRAFT_347932 [Phaeosphaeriaceae sp. SRC1lsM3a]|nr:hypothetical protein IQ06DRAFT_347932 [Stagonospora sp. SRC1lsM3a]